MLLRVNVCSILTHKFYTPYSSRIRGVVASKEAKMQNKYTRSTVSVILNLYASGIKVSSICSDYAIPRSTVYYWLNKCRVIKQKIDSFITSNDVHLLNKKLEKIQIENHILKECGCTLSSSRKDKLEAIARLDGQYTIHALCRALNILRSTYYHFLTRVLRKNKLKRRFTTDKPNKVWVSDIISFNLNYKPHYMCAVIDLYSRKVISYNISNKQETELVLQTFKDAYALRKPKDALMFHSDQGLQYTSYAFRKQLRDNGVMQSFSNPGYPHDNAVAESFFRSFKSEEVYQHYYKTYAQMKASIDEFIYFFNEERPHQSFNYLTPVQVEENYSQKE